MLNNRNAIRGPDASYVPEVDALRALAMTGVIIFHCKLMPFGWMGVWLFYVVSGFAVATSLFGRQQRESSIGSVVVGFYMRRVRRIWPLYFAVVGLNVVVLLAIGRDGPLEEVPSLLTFTYNLKMISTAYTPAINWPSFQHLWTLSVEQQVYLVFPLLLLLRDRSERAVALVGVISAAPLIRVAVSIWASRHGWDPERCAFAVYAFGPAHFDAFAVGALIAFYRTELSSDARIARAVTTLVGLIVVVYIGVYTTLGVMRAGPAPGEALRNIVSGILFGQGRQIFVYYLPLGIGAAALIAILSGQRHCIGLCRLPGLQAVGRISYGGYILHLPVLSLLVSFVPLFRLPANTPLGIGAHIVLFVCAYSIIVGAAWLSFTYFEQPSIGLGRARKLILPVPLETTGGSD